jgi:hypothetical protein
VCTGDQTLSEFSAPDTGNLPAVGLDKLFKYVAWDLPYNQNQTEVSSTSLSSNALRITGASPASSLIDTEIRLDQTQVELDQFRSW